MMMPPQASWIPDSFGVSNLKRFARLPSSTSQIIWTYGLRDPWHVGGLLSEGGLTAPYRLNNETEVIVIPDGSHCADMAPSRCDLSLFFTVFSSFFADAYCFAARMTQRRCLLRG